MEQTVYFISHANVTIDPTIPVTQWGLSDTGQDRHLTFNQHASHMNISAIYSSAEKKATDAADILSKHLGIDYVVVDDLHENDRTATGYLPSAEFELVADEFFEQPDKSVRGWERSKDAQTRIVTAIDKILTTDASTGSIALSSHGAVGALLLCYLSKIPITREMDQPGSGGGNFFAFTRKSRTLLHDWKNISHLDND